MRKCVAFSFVNPVNGNVPDMFKDTFQNLFQKDTVSQPDSTVCTVLSFASIPFMPVMDSIDWSDLTHVHKGKEYVEDASCTEDVSFLMKTYQIMYPQTDILKENIPHVYMKFKSIAIGDEKFGSIKQSRSSRSCNVTAIWASEGGKIDVTNSLTHRPGQVQFYFEHCLSINGVSTPHIFGNVRWYKKSSYHGISSSLTLWKAYEFETGGECSFIPVQRLCGRIAQGFERKGHSTYFVACPLPRMLCG